MSEKNNPNLPNSKKNGVKILLILTILISLIYLSIFVIGKLFGFWFFLTFGLQIFLIILIFFRLKFLKIKLIYLTFSLIIICILSFIFMGLAGQKKDENQIKNSFSQNNYKKNIDSNTNQGITTDKNTKGENNYLQPGSITDQDLGMFTGTYYSLNIKHTKIDSFDVVLDGIVVVEKPFGRIQEGYTNRNIFTGDQEIVKYVVVYYTVTAKKDDNLKNLQNSIIYEGGIRNGGSRSDGVNQQAYDRFGFHMEYKDEPIKIGETKKVIMIHGVDAGMMTANKISLQYMKYYSDTNREQRLEVDITKYLK